MPDEIKKTVLNTLAEPIANSAKNLTDKPTQNIGTTLADIWYLVFGGISQAAEKRKLKYSYALQEFEKELQDKISQIPEDKLIEPDTQIVAQALDASKYCVEKEELRHMFKNLITSSLNIDYQDSLSPIFSNIIRQLSIFDAKLFNIIYYHNINAFLALLECNLKRYGEFIEELSSSFVILQSLGLIQGINLFSYYDQPPYGNLFDPVCIHNIFTSIYYMPHIERGYRVEKGWQYMLKKQLTENDVLDFVELTILGKKFGICCCD